MDGSDKFERYFKFSKFGTGYFFKLSFYVELCDGFFLILVLTNDLELYIISLEKAKNSTKNKKEELYNWLKFINNPKEVTRNGR